MFNKTKSKQKSRANFVFWLEIRKCTVWRKAKKKLTWAAQGIEFNISPSGYNSIFKFRLHGCTLIISSEKWKHSRQWNYHNEMLLLQFFSFRGKRVTVGILGTLGDVKIDGGKYWYNDSHGAILTLKVYISLC